MTQWQPIETAPKDGTEILIYHRDWDAIHMAAWATNRLTSKGYWMCVADWSAEAIPTHWQPHEPPES